MGLLDAALADTARAERDHRFDSYSTRGRAGELADLERASLDYQCWVAIAEWLETDRFKGFYGGAEPERDDAPWITWPRLQEAAHDALAAVRTKADAELDNEKLQVRRARLVAIHRKVQLRRQMIESINAEFRAMQTAEAA